LRVRNDSITFEARFRTSLLLECQMKCNN
jgi:hypothetical protein